MRSRGARATNMRDASTKLAPRRTLALQQQTHFHLLHPPLTHKELCLYPSLIQTSFILRAPLYNQLCRVCLKRQYRDFLLSPRQQWSNDGTTMPLSRCWPGGSLLSLMRLLFETVHLAAWGRSRNQDGKI